MDTVREIETSSIKDQQWHQAVNTVNDIESEDPHGLKIDQRIKKAVIGLNAFGFTTTMSCEGHLDHGSGYPYIRIADREAQQQAEMATQAYVLQRHLDYERLKEASRKLNEDLLAKLDAYVAEFYTSRDVPQDVRLIVELNAGRVLLRSQGAETQKLASMDKKSQNLSAFQEEMENFADFLEQKFFTS